MSEKIKFDKLETVASYAEKSGYSVSHVYWLINTGKVKIKLVGKTRLIETDGK